MIFGPIRLVVQQRGLAALVCFRVNGEKETMPCFIYKCYFGGGFCIGCGMLLYYFVTPKDYILHSFVQV